MPDLTLKKRRNRQKRKKLKRHCLSEEILKGERYLMFGLVFIVVAIMVLFILRASSSAQQGHSLRQLQTQKSQLESDNRDLKLKVLEAQSTQNLSDEVEDHMAPIENPIYIK